MGTFGDIFECNIGGAALQLTHYTKSEDGVFDELGRRIQTKVSFQCEGYIQGVTPGNLADALATFEQELTNDRIDFGITGMSVVKEQLFAADCISGPSIKYAYGNDQGAAYQSVSFTVEAVKPYDPDSDGLILLLRTSRIAYNLEGLRTQSMTGKVKTFPGVSASGFVANGFAGNICPFPTVQAGWQITYGWSTNELDTECDFELSGVELAAAYPEGVVDGEVTMTQADDEHNRRVLRYSLSFTGPGALQQVQDYASGLNNVVRAEVQTTQYKSVTARAQYDVLCGSDGGNVLEWAQIVTKGQTSPLLREVRYAGTTPLLVQTEQSCWVYSQTGRAVGINDFPAEAGLLFSDTALMEAPEISHGRPNAHEYETAWRYRFIFTGEQSIPTFAPAYGA